MKRLSDFHKNFVDFTSKNPKKTCRIIAIACLILTCALFCFFFFSENTKFSKYAIMTFEVKLILSAISIICSIILIIKPISFYIYAVVFSIWGLLYIVDGGNTTGFMLITIAAGFAYKAGSFSKHTFWEVIGFLIPTLAAVLSQIRFPPEIYVETFIAFFGYLILLFIIFNVFFTEHTKRISDDIQTTIDLSKFDLSEEQITLLKEIQSGKTYKELAFETNVSESSIKRKFSNIFNQLGVLNLQDFLRKYGNVKFI